MKITDFTSGDRPINGGDVFDVVGNRRRSGSDG